MVEIYRKNIIYKKMIIINLEQQRIQWIDNQYYILYKKMSKIIDEQQKVIDIFCLIIIYMNKQYRKLDKQISKSAKVRNNSTDRIQVQHNSSKQISFREYLAKENLIKIPWQQNNLDFNIHQQNKNRESNFDLLSDWQEQNKIKNNIFKSQRSQRFQNRLYSKHKYKSATKIQNNAENTNIKVWRTPKKLQYIPPVTVSFEFIKNKALTKNQQINDIMQQIIKNREKQQIKLLQQDIKSININNSATFIKTTQRLNSAFPHNKTSRSTGLNDSVFPLEQTDIQINPIWSKNKFPLRKRKQQKKKQIQYQKLFIQDKSFPIENLKKSLNKVKKQKVQMKRYSNRVQENEQIPILGKKLI